MPYSGLQPALGRLFSPADDGVIDEPHAVVLSYDYWQSRFGGNSGIIGQTLKLNGQSMTIIGVAPRRFTGTTAGAERKIFAPITMLRHARPAYRDFGDRKYYEFYLFARLKPGVSMEQAALAINIPYRHIINEVEAPLQTMGDLELAQFKAKQIRLELGTRGQSQLSHDAQTPLMLLLGVTAVVLIIACSNIANLLLVRGAARAGEIAVRISIGASRRQLLGQLLTEALLLAGAGGAGGILVAQWTLVLLASLIPPDQALLRYELNTTVVWFIAALTIGTGILFGIFPALQATRDGVSSVLKGESRQTAGRGAARFRTILVTAQAAIALALLVLAGLFAKSLANIGHADLGLTTDHVISFRVTPGLNGYAHERTLAFIERVEEALAESPGVTGVTTSTVRLLGGDTSGQTVKVQGSESRDAAYTLIRARLFSNPTHTVAGGPGFYSRGRRECRQGRDRQRGIRERISSRQGRGWKMDVRQQPRYRYADRWSGCGLEIRRRQRRNPADIFPPVQARRQSRRYQRLCTNLARSCASARFRSTDCRKDRRQCAGGRSPNTPGPGEGDYGYGPFDQYVVCRVRVSGYGFSSGRLVWSIGVRGCAADKGICCPDRTGS